MMTGTNGAQLTGTMRSECTSTSRRIRLIGLAALAAAPLQVLAQTQNPGLGLPGLPYANEVEQAAADANQLVFNTLDSSCNPGGIYDSEPEPSAPPVGTSCNADRFFVYLNARELVHTANEIRGDGANVASLGSDLKGLGLALRWTAAEELAAQGSMATRFSNNQRSNLAARLNALRFGSARFRAASVYRFDAQHDRLFAQNDGDVGAAATDEPAGETYSRWGGFLNGAFGFGAKQPTPLEDAFDFDGSEMTLGVDYRFPSDVVLGGILGLGRQMLDFDEAASDISVVDGNIESDARSLILFALYQGEKLSVSGSVGAQSLDYDIERNIKYPSFNPNTTSVNSLANSHPSADLTTATFGVGYAFSFGRFTLEPNFYAEYVDMTIGAFAEERSINRLSNTSISKRFDLDVSEQNIESLDAAFLLRMQYVVTPRFGVIIPYLSLEAHSELEDNPRTITAGYAAIADILGSSSFAVPTDVPDDSYNVASVGVSLVLRGGRQRTIDGPITGGLSAFFQLKKVSNLLYYDDAVMTGGFRYEF